MLMKLKQKKNKKWCLKIIVIIIIIIVIIKPTNFEPFSVTPDSCFL